MPETVVWNKKLLVVSLLLGVAAMVLFYVYDHLKQQQEQRRYVTVLAWKADRPAGAEVADTDIGPVRIPPNTYESLKGLLQDTGSNRGLVVGGHLSRNVRRDEYVLASHIVERAPEKPSDRINPGHRAFPLRVDPYRTYGGGMRIDDRVDLLGLVSVGGKPPQAYVLVSNLRVLGIGGRSDNPEDDFTFTRGSRANPGMRVYRTMAVEVPKETAGQLVELLPRVRGKIWVTVRNPNEPTSKNDGKINPALLPVLKEPLPEDVIREATLGAG